MSEIQHTKTVQTEMQYLLTANSFWKWLGRNSVSILISRDKTASLVDMYLREHGLPLDSKIEGL